MQKVSVIFVLVFFIISNMNAHEEPVHQYIAREAYNLLSSSIGQIPAIRDHLGTNETGSRPWRTGLIVAGAFREDSEDPVYRYALNTLINEALGYEAPLIAITHFWNADAGDNAEYDVYGLGILSTPNAFIKSLHYLSPINYGSWSLEMDWPKGETEFDTWEGEKMYLNHCGRIAFKYDDLVDLYKTGSAYVVGYLNSLGQIVADAGLPCHIKLPEGEMRNNIVWEALGRVTHLLSDMSIPAHTHNDIHPGIGFDKLDAYDDWMKYHYADQFTDPIYGNSHWDATYASYQGSFINPYVPTHNGDIYHCIRYLFYTMNQIADRFPSNDASGDDSYNTSYEGDDYSALNIVQQINYPYGYGATENIDAYTINKYAFCYAIRAVAGLYYWFAIETGMLNTIVVKNDFNSGQINLTVNSSTQSYSSGSSIGFLNGTTISLSTSSPQTVDNYKRYFDHWEKRNSSNGLVESSPNLTWNTTVDGNYTYIARFNREFNLTLASAQYVETGSGGTYKINNSSVGSTGQTTFIENVTAPMKLEAVPPSGDWCVPEWFDNTGTVILGNPLNTYVPINHTTITARYKAHLLSTTNTATTGNTSMYGNNQRKIAHNDGITHTIYCSGGSIWYMSKDINGSTNEKRLGDGKNPCIGVSINSSWSTTGVHAVWEQDLAGGYKKVVYRRSTNGGVSWEPAIESPQFTGSDATPIVFGSTYPSVVWRGTSSLCICLNPPSHTSLGSNVLSGTDATSQLPSATADFVSGEQLNHLVYTDGNKIYYLTFKISGTNFDTPWQIYVYGSISDPVSTTGNKNPSITSSPYLPDSIGVAWEYSNTKKVYYRAMTAGANRSFGGIQGITSLTNLSKPSVSFEYLSGNIVVLVQYGSNIGKLIRSIDGGSWSSLVNLGSGTGPQLSIFSADEFTQPILWTRGSTSPFTINLASSLISSDVWSGTRIIESDFTIESGSSLTISAEAIIKFSSGARLIVNGTLNANGNSPSTMITFDRNGSSGTWGGVTFNAGSSGMINYCTIKNAGTGISCYGSLPTITNNTITGNTTGIYINLNGTSQSHVSYNTIQSNASCGINTTLSSFLCHHNMIISNGTYGIYCSNPGTPVLSPVLYNNKITGHTYGLYCYSSAPYLAVVNVNHQGYPGAGRNSIKQNGTGIQAVFGSDLWLGIFPNGGYNSISNNSSYGIYAYNDNIIWAQYNWWNGTPSVYQSSATVRTENYLTGGDPNPLVNSISNGSQLSSNNGIMLKTSTTDNTTSVTSPESKDNDPLLQAMFLEFEDKNEEAISKYQQIFLGELNTCAGRYALRRLNECYRKTNRKVEFDGYIRESVRPKVTKNDELSALLVEFENQKFLEDKDYNGVVNNLLGMLKVYKDNESLYKQTLFNLSLLYLHTLNDRPQAVKYFSKLAAKYPSDQLIASAEFLLGEELHEGGLIKEADEELELAQYGIPTEFGLSSNYPNPFNPSTVMDIQVPAMSHVTLKIYDLLGRQVITLIDGVKNEGYYSVKFNAQHLTSGIYFARMVAVPQDGTKPFSRTMKMLLTK